MYLQELECKCNQMDLALQRAMEDSDSLHQRYNEGSFMDACPMVHQEDHILIIQLFYKEINMRNEIRRELCKHWRNIAMKLCVVL